MQVSNYLDKRVPSIGKKNTGLDSNIALLQSITYSYNLSPNNNDSVNKRIEKLFLSQLHPCGASRARGASSKNAAD